RGRSRRVTTAVSFILTPANEATTTPERRGLARDGVRLLVTDLAKRTQHDAAFRELPWFLRRGDLLVANDSATLPAALVARRADGTSFPLHLSTRIGGELWIAEPRAPVAAGERAALADGGTATFLAPVDTSQVRLWYTTLSTTQPVAAFLARHGTPIRYRYVPETLPLGDYQTIFARVPGSAEMPSAGRPFSRRSLDDLRRAGVAVATVTLHTGVSSQERHERPYREWFDVSAQTAAAVAAARLRGGRVIAVGTTVVRALESAVRGGEATAASGWTGLIVTRDRGVALVDGLLTGFHEPQASHLDLLRAFADDALLERAYGHALDAGYLWHEFGDVHLLL
ncbi:MAG TPA: S-adenosylmethionine:tRNA ribosyltransferase-isomerase, partial [Xanthomonadales bacterium]|nr:S-adenosylmethionine:tRNA ribosyltransferase-isomerase [Xanthomonadales bacterium]